MTEAYQNLKQLTYSLHLKYKISQQFNEQF
jgi:hypothetical protein